MDFAGGKCFEVAAAALKVMVVEMVRVKAMVILMEGMLGLLLVQYRLADLVL